MQGAEAETVRRVGDVLAERPPHALGPCYAPLASPTRTLRIDVYGVDARPPRENPRRDPVLSVGRPCEREVSDSVCGRTSCTA